MSTALSSTSQGDLGHTKRRGFGVWLRPQDRRTHRICLCYSTAGRFIQRPGKRIVMRGCVDAWMRGCVDEVSSLVHTRALPPVRP